MFIRFSVENYLSLREEQTIDFVKHKHQSEGTEGPKHGIEVPGHDIDVLPVIGIFGPNASGKTNILSAMAYLDYLLSGGSVDATTWNKKEFRHAPFAFDRESSKKPSKLFMAFSIGSDIYEYGLSISQNSVCSESLSIVDKNQKEIKIFSRSVEDSGNSDLNWGFANPAKFDIPKAVKGSCKNIKRNKLVLHFLFEAFELPFIVKFISGVIHQSSRVFVSNSDVLNEMARDEIQKDGMSKKAIISFLNLFGSSFDNLVMKEGRLVAQYADVHGKKIEMDFDYESQGFIQLLKISAAILRSLKTGSFALIDELDAHLHHVLIKKIIGLYSNPNINTKGAQLVFTSHDLNLLDHDMFRREQIYLSEKLQNKETKLVSLIDFYELKQKTSFLKSYLSGRFRSLPILKSTETFEETVKDILELFESTND